MPNHIKISGEVAFANVHPSVNRLLSWEEMTSHGKNMITNAGFETITALLAGGFGNPVVAGSAFSPQSVVQVDNPFLPGAYIAQMHLGISSSPTLPQATDTQLSSSAAFISDVQNPEYPTLIVTHSSPGVVEFRSTIPAGTLDGSTITEEGLFSAKGALLARRVIDPGWDKQAGLHTQIIHRFTFQRA